MPPELFNLLQYCLCNSFPEYIADLHRCYSSSIRKMYLFIHCYSSSIRSMYLFIHLSQASSIATALASVAVSSIVANKVDAPVISAAYMSFRLLEGPTAVAVYLISVGSMQHKLILPNITGAHSVCSIHSTLQTIKSAIKAIFHTFHNYYDDSYESFLAHLALFNL